MQGLRPVLCRVARHGAAVRAGRRWKAAAPEGTGDVPMGKKKWEDMDEKDLEEYKQSLTYWPYVFFGLVMAFIWTPEHTKFVWHLQLQCWIHEQYWKWNLPKEKADKLIREARIGVPSMQRSGGQDPLAACPVMDKGETATPEDLARAATTGGLPDGHPGSLPKPAVSPFTASVVQVTEDLKQAKPSA
eukprot:TRINITY_DN480_c0_g1_i1.p1 TRINITY_DN480_c0_g1~~TRINITY_DN480_c0_g1_i1.p1  ORF type:complete len:188 (+),score=54.35 TRINITY_DN480_c0_g1_i1:47-610(+)